MTIQTDALVAAAAAIKTTCDAIVAQGTQTAAAATAAAEAAVADAEKTAQAGIDASVTQLTDANAELTPLLETAPSTSGDPGESGATVAGPGPAGTVHAPAVDENGNQTE